MGKHEWDQSHIIPMQRGAQETTSLVNITCLLLKLRILINRLGYSECQGHFREDSSMGAWQATCCCVALLQSARRNGHANCL